MTSAVFADTFFWISLASPGDAAYQKASAFGMSDRQRLIITTDEVLAEFLTFFGERGSFLRKKAVAITWSIFANEGVRVLPQTHETFRAGLELYASRPDKGYSLTDCISMQTMRREGLLDVLTDDRHFEQEGFRLLLRTSG